MSVTIRTENEQYTVKMPIEESSRLFKKLLGTIFDAGGAEPVESTECDKSNMEQAHQESETITEPENIPEVEDYDMARSGYSGFLLIRCERCGKIKGFYGKAQITKYKCNDCGGNTELDDLKILWLNCECGNRVKYLTNIKDRMLDVACNRCGNPVAVEWNDKKEIYRPIREG